MELFLNDFYLQEDVWNSSTFEKVGKILIGDNIMQKFDINNNIIETYYKKPVFNIICDLELFMLLKTFISNNNIICETEKNNNKEYYFFLNLTEEMKSTIEPYKSILKINESLYRQTDQVTVRLNDKNELLGCYYRVSYEAVKTHFNANFCSVLEEYYGSLLQNTLFHLQDFNNNQLYVGVPLDGI